MFDLLIVEPPTTVNQLPPLVFQLTQAENKGKWLQDGPIKGTFALCQEVPSYATDQEFKSDSAHYALTPAISAEDIGRFDSPFVINLSGDETETLLQSPKHGTLIPPIKGGARSTWRYVPERNFVGVDRIDFLVKGKDEQLESAVEFKLIYQIKVTREKHSDYVRQQDPSITEKYCPRSITPIWFKDNQKAAPLSNNTFSPDTGLTSTFV